jgi:hypothetical protein
MSAMLLIDDGLKLVEFGEFRECVEPNEIDETLRLETPCLISTRAS